MQGYEEMGKPCFTLAARPQLALQTCATPFVLTFWRTHAAHSMALHSFISHTALKGGHGFSCLSLSSACSTWVILEGIYSRTHKTNRQ